MLNACSGVEDKRITATYASSRHTASQAYCMYHLQDMIGSKSLWQPNSFYSSKALAESTWEQKSVRPVDEDKKNIAMSVSPKAL